MICLCYAMQFKTQSDVFCLCVVCDILPAKYCIAQANFLCYVVFNFVSVSRYLPRLDSGEAELPVLLLLYSLLHRLR